MLTDGCENHRADSAMLTATERLRGFSQPEVPSDEQRFPLRQRALLCSAPQTQPQQQLARQEQPVLILPGKFPLLQEDSSHAKETFPVQRIHVAMKDLPPSRFPVQMIHLPTPLHRFPLLCQLPAKNFNYSTQSIKVWGSSPTVATPRSGVLNAFPTIKKQFVSFADNRQACKEEEHRNGSAGHGNGQNKGAITATDVVPTPTTATAATTTTTKPTVTQTSHNMSTEIDMDSQRTVDADNGNDEEPDDDVAAAKDDDHHDDHDVHKAAFDNELSEREQTLNLNVEAEGVGERKEIEHQQAENFNDAFGWRHDNSNNSNNNSNNNSSNNSRNNNESEGEDDDDDAMNAGTAKNKREICEQSKLEAAAHNELNMTKERQSICLASEPVRTIAEEPAASTRQQRQSDARESSSEQVDGQQRQRAISQVCQPSPAVIQATVEAAAAAAAAATLPRLPSLELLKSAVRALLDECGESRGPQWDIDLIDLLGELVQSIATPTSSTGNFWGEPVVAEQVVGVCPDMTLTKVGDESEATAVVVDIYSEQLEQPADLDDTSNNSSTSTSTSTSNNNNTNANNTGDMKYELLKSTTRLPEALPSRLSSASAVAAAATPTSTSGIAAPATSRIRDIAVPTTSRPLLGDTKRSSSSREDISIDVDSLLPERTRLRRQRRMRSQDSVEEKPEDVIERLNKLKARISGALSEVKGVLKQYSTESEAEAAGVKWTGPPTPTAAETVAPTPPAPEVEASQPVQFRFVRKVRRRSYFDEAEEENEKEQEKENDKEQEKQQEKETEKTQEKEQEKETQKEQEKEPEKEHEKKPEKNKAHEKEQEKKEEISPKESAVHKAIEVAPPVEKSAEVAAESKPIKKQAKQKEERKASNEIVTEEKPTEIATESKDKEEQKKPIEIAADKKVEGKQEQVQKQDKDDKKSKSQAKIEFLAKVVSELKSKPIEKEPAGVKEAAKPEEARAQATESKEAVKEQKLTKDATPAKEEAQKQSKEATAVKEAATGTPTPPTPAVGEQPKEASTATLSSKEQQQKQPVEAVEATSQTAAALPDESATQPAGASEATPKKAAAKKKTIVKVRNPRRASIAAVEPSQIKAEPVQIDALIQRRPSDSEAIVRRKKKQKLTTPTAIASGSNESDEKAATAAAATAAAATTRQLQQATTADEQLVTAKVNKSVDTAKSVTKTTAKSVEAKPEAAAAATTATAAAAANAATAATTTIASPQQTAPKQLPIDELVNQARASEESRRASLKLAELVGETVLVVPTTAAAAAAAATTTATATTEGASVSASVSASTHASASPVSSAVSGSLSQSKELINQTAISPASAAATPQQVVGAVDIEVAPAATPQIAATLSEVSHEESTQLQQEQQQQQETEKQKQQQAEAATKDNAQAQSNNSLAAMPELKVLAGPVQPVKIETVEQPHDEADLVVSAKKKPTHLKKLVRKSSIDKGKEKSSDAPGKLSNILKDKNKIGDLADRLNKLTPPKKQAKAAKEQQSAPSIEQPQQENAQETEAPSEPLPEPETEDPPVEPEPAPKKPRQVKKKVIIKRQKRRLSIGDTFFIQQEPEEPKVPEIETIEKAIAYVTDDEADAEPEPETEPPKPLKSCLHVREYKIGDLVLYAERYRKTQVRWKRGRVLERITSISYKLEIEGKEVPAHISYIKKYTGRKVKFVGKEYLDIDYEQVVEEERRARSYSIWNMV